MKITISSFKYGILKSVHLLTRLDTFLVCLYVNKLSPVYTNLKVVRTGDTPDKAADI